MAVAQKPSPKPGRSLAHRLLLRHMPLHVNPGRISCVASPAAIRVSVPTASTAPFVWSPRPDRSLTSEIHDPRPTEPEQLRPAPCTLLVCPRILPPPHHGPTAHHQHHHPALPPHATSHQDDTPHPSTPQLPCPTICPRRTIPIPGGTRGLVQHVVSAGAPDSWKSHISARAPTETTLFVGRTYSGAEERGQHSTMVPAKSSKACAALRRPPFQWLPATCRRRRCCVSGA